MPKTSKELKDRLMEAGKWPDFVKFRQDLKKGGIDNKDAHRLAVEHFFDGIPDRISEAGSENSMNGIRPDGRRRGRGRPKKDRSEVEVAYSPPSGDLPCVAGEGCDTAVSQSSSPSYSDADKAAMAQRVRDRKLAKEGREAIVKDQVDGLPKLPIVDSSAFNGRTATEVEAIRWVASNMEIAIPDIDSCPNATSGGLLSQCRSSFAMKSDFWNKMFPKLLPTKTQMDKEGGSEKLDVSKSMEVIDDLLSFKKEVEVNNAGAFEVTDVGELAPEDENGFEIVEDEIKEEVSDGSDQPANEVAQPW